MLGGLESGKIVAVGLATVLAEGGFDVTSFPELIAKIGVVAFIVLYLIYKDNKRDKEAADREAASSAKLEADRLFVQDTLTGLVRNFEDIVTKSNRAIVRNSKIMRRIVTILDKNGGQAD